MRAPLKALICIDALGIGGKERQAVELVKGLRMLATSVEFRVVCFDADDFYLSDLTNAGIAVDFIPRAVRWDLAVGRKLWRIVSAFQPDIIHTNGLVSTFYALPSAKAKRIPLINGSIRNAFSSGGARWELERLLLLASDFRVANSRAGLRSRRLPETDQRNVVIHNGFDFLRIANVPTAGSGDVDAGKKKVGMVAEFNRYKDYATFVDAARILSARRQDVAFLTVGDGETAAACRFAAKDLATVRFLGKRKDVEAIVATFDIGVLCTFVEGLSNSIMEYMAARKPVVATDGGGTCELVVDGETGCLVPARDAGALAAAIEALVDDSERCRRMGLAGHAKLVREFSLERMVERTATLYETAAGSAKRGDARARLRAC
jgi:glycosyltransferase involved in cell wall biosynthesis